MALDSYCRAFGNAQPDGRERRPGCSQKALPEAVPRPGGAAHGGTWLGRGTLQAYLSPDCQAQQSLASRAQLGLLMSSVPSNTHWITDSGQIKQVSQVTISMYGSEGTSKFQSHGATVLRSPILLVRL